MYDNIKLKPIEVCENKNPIYEINYTNNFDCLYDILVNLKLDTRKVCIITDSNVEKYHLKSICNSLKQMGNRIYTVTLPAGEKNKNTYTIETIYEKLISEKFDRNDVLCALGGGVIGDMTGFAAATYLRGIRFIQIPTSLLAMVDSSIGGKTGVDFKGYKNMVGAFHMPSAVLINPEVLMTLPEREFYSGFAEIIKHSLIYDKSYFSQLKEYASVIREKKDYELLSKVIYTSCQIKKQIVEDDPYEKGIRAFLNFGHTVGHAIEKYMNFTLLHGECVSLGCIAALYISMKKELISRDIFLDAKKTFSEYFLPVSFTELKKYDIAANDIDISFDINNSNMIDEIIAITKSDKKADNGSINFVLINEIGNAIIDKTVSDADIHDALIELAGGHNE